MLATQNPQPALSATGTGLSLVMATIGRAEEIRINFNSLAAQTDRRFEVIVVDQNPDDRLAPIVAEGRAKGLVIEHFRQKEPNLSLARNLGISQARYDIIGFPDDDCWYEPNVVEKVLDTFTHTNDCCAVVARWHEQEPGGRQAHTLSEHEWRRFRAAPASSISLFLKAESLKMHGGFDIRFGVAQWFGAGEETDLVLSLLSDGKAMLYRPEIIVHHPYGPRKYPSWKLAVRDARRRSRGTGALYAKHQLSPYVILRGFVAPVVMPLMKPLNIRGVAVGFSTAVGRIEGYFKWISIYGNGDMSS